jgi:hypothetical protein
MEYCAEYRVSIFLLYGEVVTYSILLCDASTTLDDACLVQQALRQGCFTCTVIAKQGNVLDFMCLIDFHCVSILRLFLGSFCGQNDRIGLQFSENLRPMQMFRPFFLKRGANLCKGNKEVSRRFVNAAVLITFPFFLVVTAAKIVQNFD